MSEPFRVTPAMPAHAYKTYALRSPLATHTRVAACSEVECEAHTNGWVTTIDETTTLGERQAYYIRQVAGRHYRERRTQGGLTAFTFPAGQKCFQEHRVSVDRPEFFYVKPGDWRLRPAAHEIYRHANAADWVDDFQEHQDKLATEFNKG